RQTGDSPAELLAPESRSDPPRPGPGNPRSRAALPDTARSLPAQAAQARGRPMPERPRARHRDGPAHLGIPSLHVAPPLARNSSLLCPIALLPAYLPLGSLGGTPRARRWALAILAGGAILHLGLAHRRLELDPWEARRVAAVRAIEQRDYRILAERRHRMRY